MLQVGDFDEVVTSEKLLESCELIQLVIIDIDDLQDFLCSVAMDLIMVVKVEYIGKECLRFHVLKHAIAILIMLLENDPDVDLSFDNSLFSLLSQTIHVLVEDISQEKIGKEVQSHEHEHHKENAIEETDVHGRQENVWEVCCCKQNSHIKVGLFESAEIHQPFESWPVVVVHDEYEDEDVGENCHENGK